jgi:aarF domain-containing kinase
MEKKKAFKSSKREYRKYMKRLRKKVVEWVEMLIRSIYLSFVFAPAAVTLPLALLQGIDDVDEEGKHWWWSLLRNCIRRSGPCTIKFSQWACQRADLFPLLMCTQLQDLQINAARHSLIDSLRALKNTRELGGKWENTLSLEKGEDGEPVLLGSGCIAQVFKAKYKEDGVKRDDRKSVAVKVVHPSAARSIKADTNIMLAITRVLEAVVPGSESLSLHESVQEFTSIMLRQLDLRNEAESLRIFRRNFSSSSSQGGSSSGDGVRFPSPLVTGRNVLVETLEPGSTVAELMPVIEGNAGVRQQLTQVLLDTILKMTFEDNYIHADLHSGNIMVSGLDSSSGSNNNNNNSAKSLGISIIDTGLVASLNGQDRRNFIDLFSAVVRNKGEEAGSLMIERNRHPANAAMTEESRRKFAAEIAGVVDEVHSSGLSLGRIGVAALLQKVLVACYKHQVKLESKFVSTVLAIGVVEGLGRRLDPDVDVLKKAAPYIFKATLRSL